MSAISNRSALCSAMVVLFLLLVAIVNPSGHFPLNDDWSYAASVRQTLITGKVHLPDWYSSTFIVQLFIAVVFCKVFGFSFFILRLITIFMGALSLVYTFKTLCRFASPGASFFGTLVLLVNPLFFHLSISFMTDVPAFCFLTIAIYFATGCLQQENLKDTLLFSLFVTLATLVRHNSLLITLPFLLTFRRGGAYSFFVRSFPLLAGLGAYIVFTLLMRDSLPSWYYTLNKRLLDGLYNLKRFQGIKVAGFYMYAMLSYLGLFFLPLYRFKLSRKRWFIAGLILITCTGIYILFKPVLFPLGGNTLREYGIGPPTLADMSFMHYPHLPVPSMFFLLLITILSFSGIVFLWMMIGRGIEKPDPVTFFCLSFILVSLVIYSISGFFDRYLLQLILPLLILLVPLTDKIRPWRYAVLMPIAIYTVCGTHDYLAWNRVRWKLADRLKEEKHIPVSEIDGGFEWNGWYNYNIKYNKSQDKSWWWVSDNVYMISFGPVKGYEILSFASYKRWLSMSDENIYVLKRESGQNLPEVMRYYLDCGKLIPIHEQP